MDETAQELIKHLSRSAAVTEQLVTTLKDTNKATGADRPNVTKSPVSPRDAASQKQSTFPDMGVGANKRNVNSFWEQGKQFFKTVFPNVAIPDARRQEDKTVDTLEAQLDMMKKNNITTTKTQSMLENVQQSQPEENKPPAPQTPERSVISRESVVIGDIDLKASKKFKGIFSGIGKMFGSKEKKVSELPDEGDGFWMGLLKWIGLGLVSFIGMGLAPIVGVIGAGLAQIMGIGTLLMELPGLIGDGLMAVGKILFAPLKWGWDMLTGGWDLFRKNFNLKSLGDKWDKFTTWTGEKFASLREGASRLMSGITTRISNAWDVVKNSKIGKGVSSFFGTIGNKISSFTGMFKKSPPGLDKAAMKATTVAGSSMIESVSKAVPGKGTLAKTLARSARFLGPIGAVVTAGMSVFDGVSAAVDEYKQSGSLLAAAREGVSGALSSLSFGLIDQETISGFMSDVGGGISDAVGNYAEGVKLFWTGNFTEGIAKTAEAMTFGLIESETVEEFFAAPVDKLKEAGRKLSEGAGKVWDSITGFFTNSPEVWDVLDESGKNLGSGAKKVADSSKMMENNTKSLSSQVTGWLSSITAPFKSIGGKVVDGAKSIIGKISNFFTGDDELERKNGELVDSATKRKQLLAQQINSIHNLTDDVVDIESQGKKLNISAGNMLQAAIDQLDRAQNTLNSTEFPKLTVEPPTQSDDMSKIVKNERVEVKTERNVQTTTQKNTRLDGIMSDITDNTVQIQQINNDRVQDQSLPDQIMTQPKLNDRYTPPIQTNNTQSQQELVDKMEKLVKIAESQLVTMKRSDQNIDIMSKTQNRPGTGKSVINNSVVNNNSNTSVINNSNTAGRTRIMSNI